MKCIQIALTWRAIYETSVKLNFSSRMNKEKILSLIPNLSWERNNRCFEIIHNRRLIAKNREQGLHSAELN